MGGTVRVIEGFSREVEIPSGYEGAEIYNAPRPFPATVTWQGEFICGEMHAQEVPVSTMVKAVIAEVCSHLRTMLGDADED